MKLKNKVILIITVILLVMFLLPLIVVRLSDAHSVMGLMMILFFVINPIMTLLLSVLAGTDINKLWWVPVLIAISFPLLYIGALGELILDLFVYSLGYFFIGTLMMIVIKVWLNIKK